jgi:steroid delta-isomerase-like uncharacterized protein
MATDNIALVRRLIEEVWNKGNLDVLGELVADKYVGVEPIIGEVRGMEPFRKHVQSFRSAFPDLRITIEDIGLSGDRIFVRWTARGTHRGAFLGIPPTNNRAEVKGIAVDRVSGGKLVEHQQSYDTLAFFQALGVVPPLDRLVKTQPSAEQVRSQQV